MIGFERLLLRSYCPGPSQTEMPWFDLRYIGIADFSRRRYPTSSLVLRPIYPYSGLGAFRHHRQWPTPLPSSASMAVFAIRGMVLTDLNQQLGPLAFTLCPALPRFGLLNHTLVKLLGDLFTGRLGLKYQGLDPNAKQA